LLEGQSSQQIQSLRDDLIRRELVKRKIMTSAGKGSGSSFGDFEAIREVLMRFEKHSSSASWIARSDGGLMVNGIQKLVEELLAKVNMDPDDHFSRVHTITLKERTALPASGSAVFRKLLDEDDDSKARQRHQANPPAELTLAIPREMPADLTPLLARLVVFNQVKLPEHRKRLIKVMRQLHSADKQDYRE